MAFDLDSLPDGPSDEELATLNTADRGNSLDAEKVAEAVAEKTEEELEAEALAGLKAEEVADETVDETPDEKPAEKDLPRDEKGKFAIPKERFDEAVGKERQAREAAEARAEELERRLEESAANTSAAANFALAEEEIAKLETDYTAAMLDGNAAVAAELMGKIRSATMALSEERNTARSAIVAANALESDRVDAVVARLEADHPVLNPKSDLYKIKLVRSILNEQRFLISSEGLAPSAALKRAAEEAIAELPAPAVVVAEGLAEVATDKSNGRKAAAVAKNLAAANKQPSALKEVGLDSDKKGLNSPLPKIEDLTQDEFNALPESTKAKMRGDFI